MRLEEEEKEHARQEALKIAQAEAEKALKIQQAEKEKELANQNPENACPSLPKVVVTIFVTEFFEKLFSFYKTAQYFKQFQIG